MNLPGLLILEGFLYALLFGGMSVLRREGLSIQFAIEAIIITLLAGGLAALTGFPIHPVLFLIILYLITMRVRLLVDFSSIFAQRKKYPQAEFLFNLAEHLWPDQASKLVVQINRGAMRLHQGAYDEAITIFKAILDRASHGFLGVKNEAATHYNLGVAYLRKELDSQATKEFNAVLDTWPTSVYARHASAALDKIRHKVKP